jgi:hypothetical protein
MMFMQLKRIVDNTSISGVSTVEILRVTADAVVENMIARPDTMMWISKMRACSDARYQQADLAGIGPLLDMERQSATNTKIHILRCVAHGASGIDFRKYYVKAN